MLWLSLCSPIVELFPNLYMSWWRPSNGNTSRYLELWFLRVLVVLVVWTPILATFWQLSVSRLEGVTVPLLVAGAFGLRLWIFDRHLSDAEVPRTARPSLLPEGLYVVAFSWIGWRLFHTVPDRHVLVPLGIVLIFSGAGMMAWFREQGRSIWLDRFGRLVFTLGFLVNLFNLHRAVS